MGKNEFSLAFSLSPIGPKGFQNLISVYGSAEKAFSNSSSTKFKIAGVGERIYTKFEKFKNEFDLSNYLVKLQKAKVEFISYGDKYYPHGLKKIPDPPIGLFAKGNKNLLVIANPDSNGVMQSQTTDRHASLAMTIGVVGTRKMTSYGAQVTDNIVSELAQSGLIIVSGMALGVDAAAHKAALNANGFTIAVLGCGVDCPYPRENERLYEEIIDNGGLVISEYPLGQLANKGTFPARNRIIAAISRGILVTEAGEASGSLITAALAIAQKKPVFAVPGPITSQVAKGSYKLIKEGAIMVSSAQDILAGLDLKVQSSKLKIGSPKFKNLNHDEKKIVEELLNEAKTIDELASITKIPITALSIILSEMELVGFVTNSSGKFELS